MSSHEWSYAPDDTHQGPTAWPRRFNAGQHQSPINIQVELKAIAGACCRGQPLAERLDQQLKLADATGETAEARLSEEGRRSSTGSSSGTHSRRSSLGSGSSSSSSSTAGEPHNKRAASHRLAKTGERQNTRHCVSTRKIFLGYPRHLNQVRLCNTGHGWQLSLPDELAEHTREYGPSYCLTFFQSQSKLISISTTCCAPTQSCLWPAAGRPRVPSGAGALSLGRQLRRRLGAPNQWMLLFS